MKKGYILHNYKLDDGVFLKQYQSFKKSFEEYGVNVEIVPTSEFILRDNKDADFVIFLDKDIYSAKILENEGIRVYNSSGAISLCDDKALTYLELEKRKIPIPKTLFAPKVYGGCVPKQWCLAAAEKFGFPVVVKECFGSLGKQVYLAENDDELLGIVEKIAEKPFMLQEYLKKGAGWDVRVIVAGGEVVGAIKRTGTDFRSNAFLGGSAEKYLLQKSEEKLAIDATNSTGCFFAGVDLIMSDDGFVVCEVNSNMLFSAAEQALGFSVSGEIVRKILNVL